MPVLNISVSNQGYSMEFNEKAFYTWLCTLHSESIGRGPYDYHINFGEGLTGVEGHIVPS